MSSSHVLRVVTLILVFIFIVPNSLATIFVNPTSFDIDLFPDEQRKLKLNLTSDSNVSSSLAFSKIGESTDWIILSHSTISIDNSTPFTLEITINVPHDASPRVYVAKIRYDSNEVPLIMDVKKNETEASVQIGKCRLDPFPTSYSLPIVIGSPSTTQQFSVLVSRFCEEEVEFKEPLVIGNTQTADGQKPLGVVGASDLGIKEPKDEALFNIQIDVTHLPAGTYTPYVLVSANYKGEKLSERIPFTITVKQGATPLEGVSVLPSYIFSATDLNLNNSYTITAQNLNPNFQPQVQPSDFFQGDRLDVSNGWVYYFKPTKIGNFKMIVYTTFQGVPIGKPHEEEIRITASNPAQLGTKMEFQFFTPNNKSLDSLLNGEQFSVLVKDNEQGNVLEDVALYMNGQRVVDDVNTFNVEGGKTYTLTASLAGFNSIDRAFSVANQLVSLTYSPFELEVGRNVSFITNPINAQVFVNGVEVPKFYAFPSLGNFELNAIAEGYQENKFTISVTEPLVLVSEIPTKVKLGDTVQIEFNKPLDWTVNFREENSSIVTPYDSGSGEKFISFTPELKGIYEVYARGNNIVIYDLTGFTFSGKILMWVGITLAVLILLYKGFRGGWFTARKSQKASLPHPKFELNIPTGEVGDEEEL